MSIVGLTDQAAALPIIGTLRKGEKKVKENAPGKDLTYFRFVTDDNLAMQMFTEAYPDQEALRTINVFLPFRTADENIESWIEEWVAGGLVHRCDGVNQVLWRNAAGGYETGSRPCQNCKGKQVGRLSVIVPELARLATVTVLTTSIHDIINLTRQLRSYEAVAGMLNGQPGDLRGIPFTLRRRKEQISTPGPDGKRVRREKWLLSIETQPRWTMLQLAAMERKALPVGDFIDQETGEVLEIPANVPLPENPFDEGDFEPEPAEPKAPPVTNGNGNGIPRKPGDLLTTVNNRVLAQYDNVDHLRNALIAELGHGWNWPKYNDTAGWQQALDTALAHARAKEQPAEQDELPF